MKKVLSWMSVGGVALLVLCAVALNSGCKKPVDRDAAELIEDAPDRTTVERPQPEGPETQYFLTPETRLDFVGYKVGGSQKGSFLMFDGDITLYGDDPATAEIYVLIVMESLLAEYAGLTPILKDERFFDTANYPDGEFTSAEVVQTDDGYTIVGDLTLMDTTRRISFPAEITLDDGMLRIQADFQVDRTWWGLTFKGVGDHIMRDRVDIIIDAYAEAL